MIDRAWILASIPHQGTMCLLDSVSEWSDARIVCRAISHRDRDNPLAIDGILGIAAGVEYAAQAMAVHGALLSQKLIPRDQQRASKAGYLTSVRDVQWQIERLDDVLDDLTVQAERIAGSDVSLLYRFSVSAKEEILLTGRASVLIDAASLSKHSNTNGNPL